MSEGFGFDIDIAAHVAAGVGGAMAQAFADERTRVARERAERNGQIMPWYTDLIPIPLVGGNGVLDQPRLLGPGMGWQYQCDGMGAQGFTAGTVNVFLQGTAGAQLLTFTSAGVFYQRHFRYLRYGERLVFQAVGITGTAAIWVNGLAYVDALQSEVHV